MTSSPHFSEERRSPRNKRKQGEYPVVGSNGIDGWHNEFLIGAPAVIIGRKGSAGKVNLINRPCWPIDTTFYVKLKENDENIIFYYYVLKHLEKKLESLSGGVGVPGLNRNDVYKLLIPDVGRDIQNQIVSEIEKLEEAINYLKQRNKEIEKEKKQIIKKYL